MCGAKSFGIVNRRILTHITPWWREKRERQRVRTWNDSNHRERERERKRVKKSGRRRRWTQSIEESECLEPIECPPRAIWLVYTQPFSSDSVSVGQESVSEVLQISLTKDHPFIRKRQAAAPVRRLASLKVL